MPNVNHTYTYSYYIYPEETNNFDGSNAQIQFKMNQPEFRDWLINKNVTEFTTIMFLKSLNQNTPKFQQDMTYEIGSDYLHMKNIELQERGYVVAALVNSNITNFVRRRRFLEQLKELAEEGDHDLVTYEFRTGPKQHHHPEDQASRE